MLFLLFSGMSKNPMKDSIVVGKQMKLHQNIVMEKQKRLENSPKSLCLPYEEKEEMSPRLSDPLPTPLSIER